ncbi:unnamed protein product [Phytophthora fragariaefolia]|uniref:Unnamed protein product n=1 Tax=Phytophthora fragariaefolia TaxID=1490495 RepID=A0A9W7CUT5_9STRA|nr:unnamed protein product [Phytophthora fragariaefolia]
MGAVLATALQSIVPASSALAQAWALPGGAAVAFECPSAVASGFVALQDDGALTCAENATMFLIDDVARTFVTGPMTRAATVLQQLVKVAESVFPQSLVSAFVDGQVLSIVVVGLALGVSLVEFARAERGHGGDSYDEQATEEELEGELMLLQLVASAEAALCRVLTWLLKCLPVGVAFMISSVLLKSSSDSSLPTGNHNTSAIATALALMAVLLLALVLDVVVMLLLVTLFTRSNPFAFLEHLLPAQLVALSSASPLVALPSTVSSIVASKRVSPPLAFIVCSMGTVLNQTGTALYLSVSALFVLNASSSGAESGAWAASQSAGTYTTMMFANAFLASVVSPLPMGSKTAALATILGPVYGVPTGPRAVLLAVLAAMEWITDPFVSCVNITNNALISLVIAHYFEAQPTADSVAEPDESGANDAHDENDAEAYRSPTPDLRQQRVLGMIHSENWHSTGVSTTSSISSSLKWQRPKRPIGQVACREGTSATDIDLFVQPSEAMDWQFDGFHEPKQEERQTNAALRAAAAGIPAESVETATTGSFDDVGSLPLDRSTRDPLTMTMSPPALSQFRDPISTFYNQKGVPWPGAAAQAQAIPNEQDDMLVDLYYKTPSLWMTTMAGAIGFAVGAVLNHYSLSEDVQIWIGFLGSLLIRALQCLTLPLIFTSVTRCFSNLVVSDKTRSVLIRLAIYFILAALVASCVGVAVVFCFSGMFEVMTDPPDTTANFQFILRCPNGKFFSRVDDCEAESVRDGQVLTAANVTGLPDDLQLSLASASGVFPDTQSLAAQIVLFFGYLFTENITGAFVSVQFLGVTIFSMIIGATIMKVYDPASRERNHVLVLIRQVHIVLEMIINWLVPYIPLGTLSMATYSIMTGEISRQTLHDSLYFALTMVVALLVNFFLVACVVYVILVRRNPLKFTWFLMPGIIFMLATGDYLATIPVLIRSLEKSRQVSRTMAQFTICLGMCLCLCGTAVFFVVAPIFMAYTSGLGDIVTAGRVIGLVVIATASSIGTPLVPGSVLTFTCTIWRTLFSSQVPGSFVCLAIATVYIVTEAIIDGYTVGCMNSIVAFLATPIANKLLIICSAKHSMSDPEATSLSARKCPTNSAQKTWSSTYPPKTCVLRCLALTR